MGPLQPLRKRRNFIRHDVTASSIRGPTSEVTKRDVAHNVTTQTSVERYCVLGLVQRWFCVKLVMRRALLSECDEDKDEFGHTILLCWSLVSEHKKRHK